MECVVFGGRRGWLTGLVAVLLLLPSARAADLVLVSHADPWHTFKGVQEPQPDWQSVSDDLLESGWTVSPGGFGYGDPGIQGEATVLSDMEDGYSTFYIRRTFEVTTAIETNWVMGLNVDFDDGFVAYLDGVEIMRINVPGSPGEMLTYDELASGNHEASCCDGTTNPAMLLPFGAVGDRLSVGTHVLAVQGLNVSRGSSDFHLSVDLEVNEPGGATGNQLSGTLAVDTQLSVENSPYQVVGDVTVLSGVTLTIEPGVTVQFNQGLGLTMNGRLLAEGTEEQRITFTPTPGASGWNRIRLNANAEESRITWTTIDGAQGSGNITANGTQITLEHVVFTNTLTQLITVDDSSCIVRDCVFPDIQNNELIHFHGFPPDGHAIIEGNLFGTTTGYNDIIDFTGGNRPGPIVQFYRNIFPAAVDDCFDMDGCDAHIEENLFLNVRQDADRASSSNPISTGADGGNTSELVIVRNIFYNCEHSLLLKDTGSAVFQNNTVYSITPNPLGSEPPGIINFGEPDRGAGPGRGALFKGNIVWDLQADPFVNFDGAEMFLDVSQSLIQGTNWPGPGNLSGDPLFVSTNNLTYQNLWSSLALQPNSPARGTGPDGLDMGAVVPSGATVTGEPDPVTTHRTALLKVAGPGIYAYKWRLNEGPWSAEVPLTNSIVITAGLFDDAVPIVLTDLTNGTYSVSVIGKNSAGHWQPEEEAAFSRSWMVVDELAQVVGGTIGVDTTWEPALGKLLLNEDLVVTNNATLRILPGVTVMAVGDSSLVATAGHISVEGSEDMPVRFSAQEPGAFWGGLRVEGQGSRLTLRHADVSSAPIQILDGAAGTLEDCVIHDYVAGNEAILLTLRPESVEIRRCHFHDYYEILSRLAVTVVEDCLFEHILGDGFDLDAALPGSVIRDCTFRHGPQTNVDALDIGNYPDGSVSRGVLVERCLIHDFPNDKGISIGERASDIVIQDCVIHGVNSGVAVKDSSVATLRNLTISGAEHGLWLYEKNAGQGGGSANAENLILWGNTSAMTLDALSSVQISHSVVEGEPVWPGDGNVNVDPLFRSSTEADLRLPIDSPLLSSGRDGGRMGSTFFVGTSLVDSDGDTLPDPWEWGYDLNPSLPADADLDPDLDRLTNREEFLVGSNPQDPMSSLRIASVDVLDGAVRVQFHAKAGRAYEIQFSEAPAGGVWTTLTNLNAVAVSEVLTVVDSPAVSGAARFYRLILTSGE